MIVSFGNSKAELVWQGAFSRIIKLPVAVHHVVRRKLRMLAAATTLETLRVPPNDRMEQLKGDRAGQWSIRITSSETIDLDVSTKETKQDPQKLKGNAKIPIAGVEYKVTWDLVYQ